MKALQLGIWGSAAIAALGLFVACSGADKTTGAGTSVCGNGVVEGLEECDDGNAVNGDSCNNQCSTSSCGNGMVDAGEQCDDGDGVNDNACSNTCQKNNLNCGNGTLDDDEECDDGNDVNDDECTNHCTEARCGDGIVQAGEDCDDGNTEFEDQCPADCKKPNSSSSSSSGNDCSKAVTYAGVVSNMTNPSMAGSGIPAVWSYNGLLGVQAGDAMCQAIGADHVCSYGEILSADQKGEINDLSNSLTYWLHRITETVPQVVGNGMSPPGAGGRCNDWTYPTNHVADGEYLVVDDPNSNGAAKVGSFYYFFDDDAKYTGKSSDGHASSGPGAAGNCGGGVNRAVICCYPTCVE